MIITFTPSGPRGVAGWTAARAVGAAVVPSHALESLASLLASSMGVRPGAPYNPVTVRLLFRPTAGPIPM
jgi:hypothetical protein